MKALGQKWATPAGARAARDGHIRRDAGFTVYNSTNTMWSETGVTWNAKLAVGAVGRGSGTVTGITAKWRG